MTPSPRSEPVANAHAAVRAALPAVYRTAAVRLLRAGSAIVFTVPGRPQLIARVTGADQLPAAVIESRLAAHLAAHGVPVAVPADDLTGPPQCVTTPGGAAVTVAFWRHVPHDPAAIVPPETIGRLLAGLHAVPVPDWLPTADPLAVVRRWLAGLRGTTTATVDELELLTARLGTAERQWRAATASAAIGALHGDVPGNVLIGPTGPVLIDLETAGAGPLAWDLVKPVRLTPRFGGPAGYPAAVTAAYTAAGGRAELALLEALDDVAVLIAAAWPVASRPLHRRFGAESLVRLATLRGEPGPAWTAL